jgi:hypothetical protein
LTASAHAKVKTEMPHVRIAERPRKLVSMDEVNAPVDDNIMDVVLTALGGLSARCTRDLQIRRTIDRVIYETRVEMANIASRTADQHGEPPLDAGA